MPRTCRSSKSWCASRTRERGITRSTTGRYSPRATCSKIWGRARLVDIADDPDLVARLHDPAYRAQPERAVVIAVEALDWNCPQHIPQRLTLDELEPHLAALRDRLAQLEAENEALRASRDS